MKKTKLSEEGCVGDLNTWLDLFANDASLNVTDTPALDPNTYPVKGTRLEECFFEYFSGVVPTLLEGVNIKGFLRFNTRATEFRQKICGKLESFICGSVTEDGIKGMAATYSKPQKYCGKVFNVGDLTYSCKTCASDPTCVFCHFCFHQSIHKDHRFKLHTSNGTGGYCDCGDEEAWTDGPACDYHKAGMDTDESWNPFISLPIDIQCRAAFVFKFVLQYCMELLVMEQDDDAEAITIPLDLGRQTVPAESSHIVMLYNDESHSYEEVISTLTEAIGCTRQQAFQFAAVVDKEGRSSIKNGAEEECNQCVEQCTQLLQRNGKGPLKCKSMSHNVVAHQIIALDLMTWMTELIDLSDGLRRLLCLLTVTKVSGIHREWSESFLEAIIQRDTTLWKVARSRSHQLFMNNILLDMYGRKEFAITFAKSYEQLIEDFIADDHDHDISVAALSVQIFTVPSLATMLILNGNILKTCLEVFKQKLQPAVDAKSGVLDFQESTSGVKIMRSNFIINDVLYLLRQKPDWSLPGFSTNFLEAFDVFVEILKLMQGMDPIVRKTNTHISYEPNWETAFNMQLGLMPVIRLMLSWCCSEENILKAASHRCVFALKTMPPLKYNTVKNKLVVNHDVTFKWTSPHFALSRFLAGLMCGSAKFSVSLQHLLQMENSHDESAVKLQLQLMEYPLRSLVLSAQVNAQMWKRNGYAIIHQVYCYHNVRFVWEMADRDVLTLQVMASIMDPDHFMKAVLHKYILRNWSKGKNPDDKDNDKEAMEKESVVAREFLLLLFHVLSERYVAGVSSVTTKDILQREISHRLCLGPMSRSTLMKNLPFREAEEDDDNPFEATIDEILKEVAVYREPGVTGKGVFELNEESMARCNRYFVHFTKTEQAKMVEEKRRIGKKCATVRSSFLHLPPPFSPNFFHVVKLFCCDRLMKVVRNVINRAMKGEHGSEEQLEIILMIIGLGLLEWRRFREQQQSMTSQEGDLTSFLRDFNFLQQLLKEKGSKKSILNLLDELFANNDSKDYYLMGKWVKQIIQEEIEQSGVSNMDIDTEQQQQQQQQQDAKAGDEAAEKAEKAKKAAEQKRKMMEQISKMQKAFITTNSKLFDITDMEDDDEGIENADLMMEEDAPMFPVAIGSQHGAASDSDNSTVLCILCQEEEPIGGDNIFVVTSLVHKSHLLKPTTGIGNRGNSSDNLVPILHNGAMVNASSCGHVVHHTCWKKYYDSVKDGENVLQRRPRSTIDTSQAEYLCPLCKSLCNCVLPMLPRPIQESPTAASTQDMDLTEFLTYLERMSTELEAARETSEDSSTPNTPPTADAEEETAPTPPPPPSPSLPPLFPVVGDGSSWVAVFSGFHTRTPAAEDTDTENFMENFSKRLLKVLEGKKQKKKKSKVKEDNSLATATPYIWMCYSVTMQAYECNARAEGTNVFNSFTERQEKFYHALVQYMSNVSVMDLYEPVHDFAAIIFNFFVPLEATGGSTCATTMSILEVDVFGMMVSLRFLTCGLQKVFQEKEPKLLNSASCIIDDVAFKLCLLVHIVKTYLSAPLFTTDQDVEMTEHEEDQDMEHRERGPTLQSWLFLQGLISNSPDVNAVTIDEAKLKNYVLEALLPFLRCSAIFFHYLTGVKYPDMLTEDIVDNEITALLKYLNVADELDGLLSIERHLANDPAVRTMVERWCHHGSVAASRKETIRPYPSVEIRKLVDLPRDYSTLINRVSGFMCPTLANDSSRTPALCLICDTILCSQCYCCVSEPIDNKRYGMCSTHTMECGAGVGMFLRIRDCEVVLMHNHSKGLFLPSPYLDEYGETDRGLYRGNPLYLNEGRYRSLQQLWLRQRVPETIAQAMESKPQPLLPTAAVVTNWYQL